MAEQISSSRLSWLERESERWQARGLLDADTRARILAEYHVVSNERRSLIALVIVAVLMCGVGLLLLIGYNWQRIPPSVRVGIILAGVAAAFGGSAAAYRRNRQVLGETLAFAGTLVFGNAIWLIAQVLHIRGHFPDAFFWFGTGALACAWLVESRWIGVEAVVLSAAWLLAESAFGAGPIYPFIPFAVVCVGLAYRLTSPVMLCASAITAVLWVAIATADASNNALMPAAVVMAGCACFAAGRLGRVEHAMKPAWQLAGLVVLLVTFIPLMVTGTHRMLSAGQGSATALAIAGILAVAAIAGATRQPATAVDGAVALVAAIVPAWAAAISWGLLPQGPIATRAGTAAFSVLALAMGLSLIRTALGSHRQIDLVFGVLFALAFLVVRWASVIENMLWSGAFLLVTGGGLLLVARLWRARARTSHAVTGRVL